MTSPKIPEVNLTYPLAGRDTAKSGMGCMGNRHLKYLAEFIFVNVGGSYRNVKASSLPMSGMRVGGVIVLGVRESRTHGEGRQLVGISTQNSRMLTGMKFP